MTASLSRRFTVRPSVAPGAGSVLVAVVTGGAVDDLGARVAEPDHLGSAFGGRRTLMAVQRAQIGRTDARVDGYGGHARIGGERGRRRLDWRGGGAPLDRAAAVQRGGHVAGGPGQ